MPGFEKSDPKPYAGVYLPLLLAPTERCQIQLLGLISRHLPPQSAGVLARLVLVFRTWDRKGVTLRDQPVQSHLGWMFIVSLAYLAQDVNYRFDLLEVLLAEGSATTTHETRGPVS